MPPKPKYTKEQIVEAALEVVSQKGAESLTAKELGSALHVSTSPIFTVFRSMQEVQEEVRLLAMKRFESYGNNILPEMPLFKRISMKTVHFAIHEPKLYQLLFMQENPNTATFDDMFGVLGDTAKLCITTIEKDYALTESEAKQLFETMWIYTFGIGALCATGACNFNEEELSRMLSFSFRAIMKEIKSEKSDSK